MSIVINSSDEKIKEHLTQDYFTATGLGYNVLGVFLQGSQNYNLAYEGSDIDTKAIIIPSILKGSIVSCHDLRGGAALLLACLSANGTSIIKNIEYI